MSSTPPVKKACDACHRRKVRCSGGQPCKNCGQSSLQCTYLAIPQKKGPKGSRAKVISEIRDTQQLTQAVPPVPLVTSPVSTKYEKEMNPFDFNSPPVSPNNHVRHFDLLTRQTVDSCINFFFEHHYPTMPIFNRARMSSWAADYTTAPIESYCLILSLCAFIMVQPGMSFEGVPMPASYNEDPIAARYRHANALIREIHRMRKTFDYVETPTIQSVQISFFLFGSYFGLDKGNQCWFYMREASTLAHILNLDDEAKYRQGDPLDNMYNRRFYWLLLITERAHSLERHKPLSMLATIELPKVEEDPTDTAVVSGFLYLATIFRLIDDEFMALWNKAKSECSTSYLSQLQAHLADALPPELECTENQAADVKITQHWLRCMVWQLSITNGWLSSSSNDIAMTFMYPIQIAGDLIKDLRSLSVQSMEVHGVGLIEKIFDISCTLSDVIACVPIEQYSPDNPDHPHTYLNQLLNLISRLRGGASRYVPLLMAKVAENLPNLTNPLSHMPATLEAYAEESPTSTKSSPLPLLAPTSHDSQRSFPPAPTIGFPNVIRPPAFGDTSNPSQTNAQMHTANASLSQHQMFENYSPSIHSHSAHSDHAITPPTSGMPSMSNHFAAQSMQQPPIHGQGSQSFDVFSA